MEITRITFASHNSQSKTKRQIRIFIWKFAIFNSFDYICTFLIANRNRNGYRKST